MNLTIRQAVEFTIRLLTTDCTERKTACFPSGKRQGYHVPPHSAVNSHYLLALTQLWSHSLRSLSKSHRVDHLLTLKVVTGFVTSRVAPLHSQIRNRTAISLSVWSSEPFEGLITIIVLGSMMKLSLTCLNSIFRTTSSVPSHNLRNSKYNLFIPRPTTEAGKQSF